MISLAAWITVSMSALSKLSTMKRPRCAAGTSGAVGGAGDTTGAAVGSSAGFSPAGASARGPMDAGGTGGSGAGDGAGGGGTTAVGGAGAGLGARVGAAQAERSAIEQMAAIARITLLLGLRRDIARARRRKTASEARRRAPARSERADLRCAAGDLRLWRLGLDPRRDERRRRPGDRKSGG